MQAKLRRISSRVDKVPWSGVRKMFDLAQKFENVINLSVGEPDFLTPSHIVEAAFRAMKDGYTHYTPNAGLMEFREAAAEKLKKENEMEVDPAREIIATVGAMGALSIAFLTIINPGDEVLIPNPGFVSYAAQVMLAEGKPIYYPTLIEGRFGIDLEKIENLVSEKTRAILINSPSNPTGMVLCDKELKGVAEIALENDLLVISDEAYEAIVYNGAKHISIASLPEMKDRTISIFTLSKTHAMTGWRIGFATANEEIIKNMIKLQEHLCAHPSSVSQMAAVAALRGPKDHISMMVKEYSERRELIVKELNNIPGIICSKPQGTFYVFPDISAVKMSSQDFVTEILEKARVTMVPGAAFGSNGEGHVRISYTVSKEKIAEAMLRIKRAIEPLD